MQQQQQQQPLYGQPGLQQQQQQQQQQYHQNTNYTLPGIMQYLQSQFTIVEKNRMMNDLEKSSLKLKIIELESERNSLKTLNEKLYIKIQELEDKLLKYDDDDEEDDDEEKKRKLKIKHGDDIENDINNLKLDTIDVSKLMHARNFLKNSTDEILYLLKSPNLEVLDPLKLSREEQMFISSDELAMQQQQQQQQIQFQQQQIQQQQQQLEQQQQQQQQQQAHNSANSSESADSNIVHEKNGDEYVNVPISLASAFSPKRPGKNDKEINISHVSENDQIDLSIDAETIIEDDNSNEGENKNTISKSISNSISKPISILKKTSKPCTIEEIKTSIPSSDGLVINHKLYVTENKSLKIWLSLNDKNSNTKEDLREIKLSGNYEEISYITANKEFVFLIADKTSILVYLIEDIINAKDKIIENPLIDYFFDSDDTIKCIDVNEHNKILITLESSVELLQVIHRRKVISISSTGLSNTDNKVLAARFISGINGYDMVMMTSSSVVLQSLNESFTLGHQPGDLSSSSANPDETGSTNETNQVIMLPKFSKYLITSKFLILSLLHGLFVIKFKDSNSFFHVPITSDLDVESLGCCYDDDSNFYVVYENKSTQVFKVTTADTPLLLSTIEPSSVTPNWNTVGHLINTGNGLVLVEGFDSNIKFRSI
ncbi:hypothetical protein B5S31_g2582 [[Candida] boidinii]|nr:hypothetical protein B5S31_g2582 [[Candida] boidinii]